MKVSELSGDMLDYWVFAADTGRPFDADMYVNPAYSPSTNWAQGGSIIERERMDLQCDELSAEPWQATSDKIDADGDPVRVWGEGATPLIAAMRAYVASKFGNEVPDEGLQNG